MEFTIRAARKEDLELLAQVEAECFPAAEAASRKEIEKRLDTCSKSFFVAEDKKGSMLGFVNGCVAASEHLADELYHNSALHDNDGDYQMIFGLNVLPQYRRQGIGEALMRHMIASAKERGKRAVILTCKQHMVTFYSRIGYRFIEPSDSTHGGAAWYVMRYDLEHYTPFWEHKVQYYETDQMGIVHHSNYIRWFEESRVDLLEKMGIGYKQMEEAGVISPVLEVSAQYRSMTHFSDNVIVKVRLTKYNGIRMELRYEITDRESGELRCEGESQHCFLDVQGKPATLKRIYPKAHELLLSILEKG